MKQVSGGDLIRVLERHGWVLLRVNGSHHILGREGSIVRLPVRSMEAGRRNWDCCAIC